LNIEEPGCGWRYDRHNHCSAAFCTSELLETIDPLERLKKVIGLLVKEADVLGLEDEIHSRAQGEV